MRTCIRHVQNNQDHRLCQKYTRDLAARRPYKMYDEDTRSAVTMARALSRTCKHSSTSGAAAQSTRILGTDLAWLGSTACTSASLIHGAPNGLNSAYDRECTRDSPKRRTRLHLLLLARCALEAQGPRSVRALLIDTITTSFSAASRTSTSCSWWFSVFERGLRERS